MEDEYKRYQIPAFGNWDYSENLPITQYFESARQAGLLRYNNPGGDFYKEEVKRAVSTVPRLKKKGTQKPYQHVKEQKKQCRVCDVTQPPRQTRAPKPVDEDLYKIPPEFLKQKPRKKKMLDFFSRCLVPSCDA